MENLSGKYNQRVLNNKKEEATDTLKTASKKDNLKSSWSYRYFIRYTIDKITSKSKIQ